MDKVRTYQRKMDVSEALEHSIDECIKEDILSEFFSKHRQEVLKVAMLDYTFERQIELEKRDSFAEGMIEGKIEGKAEMIVKMGQEFGLSDKEIIQRLIDKLSISLENAQKLFQEMETKS